ncbi:MAG: transcription elongation factor GreA [Candidatus Falkowbacteria bacterium]
MQKILTKDGYQKLAGELKDLKEVKMPEIIDRIEKAKEMGDLSENAEYQEAKDTQGFMAARIAEIEATLKSSIIMDEETGNKIGMSTKFVAKDAADKEREFQLVSFNEADPMAGKISIESPLGSSFYGHKKGDKVEVETPRGIVEYKVIEIKK